MLGLSLYAYRFLIQNSGFNNQWPPYPQWVAISITLRCRWLPIHRQHRLHVIGILIDRLIPANPTVAGTVAGHGLDELIHLRAL